MRILTEGPKFEATQKALKLRNAKFRKLSRPQQRVAIAKDVIKQLQAKKFLASHTYFEFGRSDYGRSDYGDYATKSSSLGIYGAEEANLDMSECVSQVSCSVCGIGSLFAGAVLNADKLKLADFDHERDSEVKYLKRWFSPSQLDLVEVFFEQWEECSQRSHGIYLNDKTAEAIEESPIFLKKSDTQRLTMIMQNIVSNGGKFDPFNGRHKIKESK